MRDGLIYMLADPDKVAKLRTICNILNSLGKALDYSHFDAQCNPTPTRYIDFCFLGDMSLGKVYDTLFAKTYTNDWKLAKRH